MSWVEELERVYDICEGKHDGHEAPVIMFHLIDKAHITISLNKDGTIPTTGFADIVSESDDEIIVPITEESGAKSGSGSQPRPLFDEIQYLAGDCYNFFPNVQKSFFDGYISNLKKWAESDYCTGEVRAVYNYLSEGRLLQDLIDCNFINTDSSGKIPLNIKKGKKDKPDVKSKQLINNKTSIEKCKVRFRVGGKPLWKDEETQRCFIKYTQSLCTEKSLCYGSGKQQRPASKSIYAVGTAKLISADHRTFNENFTGRFEGSKEAFSLGYETSSKIHNSLKWLLNKSVKIGNICVIVWESALKFFPKILESSSSFFGEDDEAVYDAGSYLKNQVQKSLFGHTLVYPEDSKIMIMVLESPQTKDRTFKGRLSMTLYDEYLTSDFLDNVRYWHDSISWCSKNNDKSDSFSVYQIAKCAYGIESEASDKGTKGNKKSDKSKSTANDNKKMVLECKYIEQQQVIKRLLPCIIRRQRIPADLVSVLFERACSPMRFDLKSDNWNQIVSCACGLIRKQIIEEKGECTMAFDTECRNRDYLFGSLLAIADAAEESTFDDNEKGKRFTNAKRYFNSFHLHPSRTWTKIYEALIPYYRKMNKATSEYVRGEIFKFSEKMSREDFENDNPLKPIFLHAYSCQFRETELTIKQLNSKNNNYEEE